MKSRLNGRVARIISVWVVVVVVVVGNDNDNDNDEEMMIE